MDSIISMTTSSYPSH